MLRVVLTLALLGFGAVARGEDETREEAWWTGPLLAASAATLPQGHMLIEPYVYDVESNAIFDNSGNRHSVPGGHELGSQSYVLYGITDNFGAGMIPRIAYEEPAGAPNSSGIGVGDLTLQGSYGLLHYQDGHLTPAIALVVQETLPLGRYDHLSRLSDGFGAGTYTTAFAVYTQDYFWMPNGRILRARLDLTYSVSSSASVQDQSVYGTTQGFRGRAYPGDSFTADAAAEYSLTQRWVLALDVVYAHNDNTLVSGTLATSDFSANSGSGYSVGFAPAVEYNWSPRFGVIAGVRLISLGRNSQGSVTPVAALNMVF
jgi:hypothetical protein